MIREAKIVRGRHGLSAPRWFTTGRDFAAPPLRTIVVFTVLAVLVGFGGVYARQTAIRSHTADQQRTTKIAALAAGDQTKQRAPVVLDPTDSHAPALSQPNGVSPSPNSSASNNSSQTAPAQPTPLLATLCDGASQTLAATKRQLAITSEDAYHQAQLTFITTTHALDRLVRPSYYDSLIVSENTRHTSSLQTIENTYTAALQATHC